MVGYIIPVSANFPQNWALGRDNGVWAMKKNFHIRQDDDLFFWISQKGMVAWARVREDAVAVEPSDALPWPDHRVDPYKWKFDIEVVVDEDDPVLTSWSAVQDLMGNQGAANRPAIKIDTSTVPLFTSLFVGPELGGQQPGPPASNDAQPDLNSDDVARDERKYVLAAIARRLGQAPFRASLLDAFDGSCAVTGSKVHSVLEAAHISPYKGASSNNVKNGLLLRSDIHTLFDLFKLTVLPDGRVSLSPELHDSEYASFEGSPITRIPDADGATSNPSVSMLATHNALCSWLGQWIRHTT